MQTSLDGLSTKWLGRPYLCFEELGSTNDYVKENGAGLAHGTAVTARRQTAGKGRLGRQWSDFSEDEMPKSLALSALFKPPSVHHTQGLPFVCALAVSAALSRLAGSNADIGIKWPNDIVLNGKKVCGILCEGAVRAHPFAVCGIGMNLTQEAEEFTRLGLPWATSLCAEGFARHEPDEAAALILNALEGYYERLISEGLIPLLREYKTACITLGREVRVIIGGDTREGLAEDMDEAGALLVRTPGGLLTVNAGEASVRGLYGYV